ncbi:hypothetical protein HYG81_20465 (plasmid) [Natrinema zhouii]|uniref:hypothetical protein n=1 Tax=Natrinema zhouii TaxID=1710539 RepID=UPI001CFFDE64|nr:hypothetical protein [Natrinema zhouii]UHQ98001.1 hypothetical protein HYG81_20465 [Natrinema zhouii]
MPLSCVTHLKLVVHSVLIDSFLVETFHDFGLHLFEGILDVINDLVVPAMNVWESSYSMSTSKQPNAELVSE